MDRCDTCRYDKEEYCRQVSTPKTDRRVRHDRRTNVDRVAARETIMSRCKLTRPVLLTVLIVAIATAQLACSSAQKVASPAASTAVMPAVDTNQTNAAPSPPAPQEATVAPTAISDAALSTPAPEIANTPDRAANSPEASAQISGTAGAETAQVLDQAVAEEGEATAAAHAPAEAAPITATAELAPPVVITATLDAANGYFNQNPLPLSLTRGPKQVSARHNYYAPAGTLGADEPVTLTGRNEQGSWVELRRADGSTGWAMGHIFVQDGIKVDKAAIEQLPVVEAPEPTTAERINMITFSGFSPDDEAFVRATLLEMVEGDQAGRLHIPLTLAEFQAAPPLSDSSRARLLAVEALQDLPAELRTASSWEIFRWHWQNQFGFPVEMVFEGYTREDGVVIVPPLRETLLGGTYVDQFKDGVVINYAENRSDRPLFMWQVMGSGRGGYQAYVFLTDQIIKEARYGNRGQQLIFEAALAKELWAVAVIRQLMVLSEASNTAEGAQLNNILNWDKFDPTLMTENISHLLVYRALIDNGYPDDNYTDFYLDTAHDLLVLLRDYPLD